MYQLVSFLFRLASLGICLIGATYYAKKAGGENWAVVVYLICLLIVQCGHFDETKK